MHYICHVYLATREARYARGVKIKNTEAQGRVSIFQQVQNALFHYL